MRTIRLGRTELRVTAVSFGALPIQRISKEDSAKLVRRAYDSGINYFDTANAYTDSEEKLGAALHDVRQNVVISTKSGGGDKAAVLAHIEESLRRLQTDCIDLFQFHNPAQLPDPEDPDGPFAAALEMQRRGYIRHIGITNHRLPVAREAIASGNFETLQFPFSYLSAEQDIDLVNRCKEADLGFIAMKGLSGGLLNNAAACYAFLRQYENVVPIWGIQHEHELELELAERDPGMTEELEAVIRRDREELSGDFCRSCGYCLPCTVGIDIPQAARMIQLLGRSPYRPYMTEEWHAKMHKIEECVRCGACKSRCPYGMDTPDLLRRQLADYDRFYAKHHND